MIKFSSLLTASLLLSTSVGQTAFAASAADNAALTARFYDSLIKGTPKASTLNLFVTRMPKGGDLHHHFSGAIYVENYLDWLAANNGKIDSCTYRIVQANTPPSAPGCSQLTVAELKQDNPTYRKLLTVWSDADYGNHVHLQPPPDSNFFNTFGYFSSLAAPNAAKGMAQLKQRALDEQVSYIETMFASVGFKEAQLYDQPNQINDINTALRAARTQDEVNSVLAKVVADAQQSDAFRNKLAAYVSYLEQAHAGIDDDQFMMRYQTYAGRTQDPLQVFLDLYSGFRVAYKTPLVVGVNIVAPENNYVSLADYTLHMRMFNFLNHHVKAEQGETARTIKLALHAGELTLGMVTPEDLQFHIGEAVKIAGANRIGHAVDISYERDSVALLQTMKAKQVAVEINLTSNEFILGVKGNEHPYLLYSAYGVPMVISTDDAGVSRNNLSSQYLLLATRYAPSYRTLKSYAYNSITYSFLNDADKARARTRLDKQFTGFEAEMAKLYGVVKGK
ncbi:adenosine deaminase [Burkholderiaceae bacterium DAT-1]|nr:adenosine deaminase [Burkholderiaceae bacterium DAT-1]